MHSWTVSELRATIQKLLPPGPELDLAVIRPPPKLQPRERPFYRLHGEYGSPQSLGYEAISHFPTMIVLVLYCDVAADYYIRQDLVPGLAEAMRDHFSEVVCYYDGYRILRKEAAVHAGLGRIGRNALFFSRRFGFNCKIDMLLTSVVFDSYDEVPERPYKLGACIGCDVCIDACPVKAYDNFQMNDPKACDELITPKWNTPSEICRNCITSCPPSNTILERLHDRGLPKMARFDGVMEEGTEEGTAAALYRRIPAYLQESKEQNPSGEFMDPDPTNATLLPLHKYRFDRKLDIQRLFDIDLPSAMKTMRDIAAGIDATFQFSISGPGGGQWFIDATAAGPSCVTADSRVADCEFRVASEDFHDLFYDSYGAVVQLLKTGKLKVSGDLSKALRARQLFQLVPREAGALEARLTKGSE